MDRRRLRERADHEVRDRTTGREARPARRRDRAGSGWRGKCERVQDFGAGGEFLKVDGAEGDCCFAKSLGDGVRERCGCARGWRCGILASWTGGVHAVQMSANKAMISSICAVLAASLPQVCGGRRLSLRSLRGEVDVQLEGWVGSGS